MAPFGSRPPTDPAGVEAALREAVALRAAGRTARARRAFQRVVDAVPGLPSQHRAAGAALRGAALLGLGDLAMEAGDRAGALGAYHLAATLTAVPPEVARLLAEDVAARGDVSPTGLWHLANHVAHSGHPPDDDPVAAHVNRLCWPPPGSPPAAHQLADALARQILVFVPATEWAHLARGMALAALGRSGEAFAALCEAERWGPWRAATPYHLGLLLEAADEPEQAADAFRRSVVRDPTRPGPLAALGRACLVLADRHPDTAERHLAEAVDSLTQAGRLAPRDGALWHRLGLALARTDPVAARQPLTTAVGLDPDNPRYVADRAELLARLGEVDEAVASLWRPVTAGLADLDAAALLGRLLVDAGRCDDAEPVLREALRRAPGHRAAGLELARCLLETDRPARAVNALSWIRDRTAAESHLLGRAHARTGALDRAVDVLRDGLRGGTTPATRYDLGVTLGCVHARQAAWVDAVAAFDAARDAYGNADGSAPAELDLFTGLALHRAGDLRGAAVHLDAACAAAPDDPRMHCALGALALDRGDRAGATAAFDRAVAADPGHADARFGRGVVLELDGDPEAAAAEYERGLRTRPGWVPVLLRLAAIAIAAGRPRDAVATLAAAPEGPEVSAWLALAHAHSGDHARATALWEALRHRGPGDADGAVAHNLRVSADHLAVAALRRGDLATALRHWETCRAAAPDDPRYRVAVAEVCLRTAAARLTGDPADHDGAPDAGDTDTGDTGTGDPDTGDAAALVDTAAELVPDDPRPARLRALLALREGNPQRARALLAPLAARGDHEAWYHLALAEAMDGRPAEARRRLDGVDPAVLGPLPGILRATVDAHDARFSDALTGFRAALAGSPPSGQLPDGELPDGQLPDGQLPDFLGDALFAAVARCAAELGTPAATVDALTPFADRPAARRYLGLAHADLGEAAAVLELLAGSGRPGPVAGPPDGGAAAAVRAAVVVAHLTLARRHAEAGDLPAAADAAEAAASADPDGPQAAEARELAARRRAAALSAAGRPAAALAACAARLDDVPTDVEAVHHVAVLARRALDDPGAPDAGRRDATGEVTHLLVASWAAVLESPAFWVGLEARTGRPVEAQERLDARRRFSEELTRMLRDRAGSAASGRGGAAAAVQPEADDVAWGLELRTAAAVRESGVADRVAGWTSGFACGPIMLDRMAQRSRDGARLAGGLRAAVDGERDGPARRLVTLLGPLGRARHLLDDGLLDAAVTELDLSYAVEEAAALLAEALPALAVERAQDGAWGHAVEAFVRAAAVGADLSAHTELIQRSALRRVEQLRGADGGLRTAVDLLESVHGLVPPDPDLDAHLAASYAHLARQVNNDDDYAEAVALLRKALALTPDDTTTRHFAKVAMTNLAHELVRDGDVEQLREGFALFREALAHVDGDDRENDREQIANTLFGLARDRMDAGHFPTAVTLLQEALVHEDDAITRRLLAAAHQRTGGHDDAVAVLVEGHARIPDDDDLTAALAQALGHRGVARAGAGDRRGARVDLAEAVRLDPHDRELAGALRRLGS